MTPALEDQLRERFPAMLEQLEWTLRDGARTHAFEHRDGWYRVVVRMLELLEPHGVKLLQVKQKFGALRVYVDKHDTEIRGIINDAERRSRHVCERCGFGDWSGLTGGCRGCGP